MGKNMNKIEKLIDEHYWLFGEQYHLVTTTEAKVGKALRSYIYLLNGEDKKTKIDHPDKNKEMDIFLCNQNKLTDTIDAKNLTKKLFINN